MENIFKNAYFDKAYRTRDGRKAIFLGKHPTNCNYDFAFESDNSNSFTIQVYQPNGRHYEACWNVETYPNDIISEWDEEIDEDKMDESFQEFVDSDRFRSLDTPYFYFCEGYRSKAIEGQKKENR